MTGDASDPSSLESVLRPSLPSNMPPAPKTVFRNLIGRRFFKLMAPKISQFNSSGSSQIISLLNSQSDDAITAEQFWSSLAAVAAAAAAAAQWPLLKAKMAVVAAAEGAINE